MAQRILTVGQWISSTNGFHLKDEARELAQLGDGGWLSIQASRFHHCSPRVDNARQYHAVEIGRLGVSEGPSTAAALLTQYERASGSHTIYAEVPVAVADRYVAARGGIVVSRE